MANSCEWPGGDPLMIACHDEEWGIPVHDDNQWFEHIILDGAQAGLSCKTILHRREGYRKAFAGTTIVYAFMQAAGLVNDHITGCFRHPHPSEPNPKI